MTVVSLWKALDRAGCGKRVGAKELQDHHGRKTKTNPWNVHEMNKLSRCPENQPVLAVDLSIWICEALSSTAMKQNHVADPPLQLVYSRVLKLLTLGIKLVVVVEGKRRSRAGNTASTTIEGNDKNDSDGGNCKIIREDKFRKRRSGTLFWNACERCEAMLKLLGVLVVRAKAEGEALCALLNQRGIVDGVISNDGDCLLFGAKVLYTKFSVENLDHSNVIRYDANDIRAVVDDDDADRYDETGRKSKHGQDIVELTRNDLIAFAILTGSDLAGDGLSKVGCRKAIRFIRKCQIDNPLKLDGTCSPALEQLLSWEQRAASSSNGNIEQDNSGPRCSCCGHLGTKRDHKKYGCKGCGTEPGEPCFQLSPGGRFRKLLRSKALNTKSSFDPSLTLRAYREPNENQLPLCLVGKTARSLKMNLPQLETFLQLPYIIRGRSLYESHEFVRKSLSAYLARQELFELMSTSTNEEQLTKLPKNHNRPAPVCVNKLLLRNGKPSCEVKWVIKATTSDAEGNPMDQYEFSTIEDESAIKKCYPKLFENFQEEQKKIQEQGTAEQEKRRSFLLSLEQPKDKGVEMPVNGPKKSQTRKDFFDQAQCIHKAPTNGKGVSDDVKAIFIQETGKKDDAKDTLENGKIDLHIGRVVSTEAEGFKERCPERQAYLNEDAKALLGEICGREHMREDSSTIITADHCRTNIDGKFSGSPDPREDYFRDALTPGHKHYLGIESVFQFRNMEERGSRLKMNALATLNSMKGKPMESVLLDRTNQEGSCWAGGKAQPGRNLESKDQKGLSILGSNFKEESLPGYERFEHLDAKNLNTDEVLEAFPSFDHRRFCNVLQDHHRVRIQARDQLKSIRQNLESSHRFDSGRCETNGRHIDGNKKGTDQQQSHFYPSVRESNHTHVREQRGVKRKRHLYQKAENCDGCFKKQCSQSQLDGNYLYGDSATSNLLRQGLGEDIICYEKENVHKKARTSRTPILRDQKKVRVHPQRDLTNYQEESHRFGRQNQNQEKMLTGEDSRWYWLRDGPSRGEFFMNQLSLDPAHEFEDRDDVLDFSRSQLFRERADRRDEFHCADPWGQELRSEHVFRKEPENIFECGSACCLDERGVQHDHHKRNYMGVLHPPRSTTQLSRRRRVDELEERVARKLEARNRRAEIDLLCSKYIEQHESCW